MAWLLPQRGKPLCTQIASRERDVGTIVYLSGDETSLTLESAVCLYVFAHEGVLDSLELRLVPASAAQGLANPLHRKIEICDNPPKQISDVTLPAILMKDEPRVISGLCAIIRYILLRHERLAILGFRAACLASCAQVSLWTAFCERDMLATATSLQVRKPHEALEFPSTLLVLENQLRQPVRTHNDKHLRRLLKVDELSHDFVEGNVITLSDLVLFLPIHLILAVLRKHFRFGGTIPKVLEWHTRMCSLQDANAEVKIFMSMSLGCEGCEIPEVTLDVGKLDLPRACLYSRSKLNEKMSIKNKDATVSLEYLKNNYSTEFDDESQFSLDIGWDSLPEAVRPESGSLPTARIQRKREQLSNVINAVLYLAQDEPITIVDFCSGGGHVGIALAYLLPKCCVYLIENKSESMFKARERVQVLGLTNIRFYQCNLDQFLGKFDLGVALHACGGATDLVIEKCLAVTASLVSVPCCYGSISSDTPSHSDLKKILDQHEDLSYGELCRLADRNENPEGDFCMECVDTCRAHHLRRAGYNVILTKLYPLCCTPKNNMIVAKRPNKASDVRSEV